MLLGFEDESVLRTVEFMLVQRSVAGLALVVESGWMGKKECSHERQPARFATIIFHHISDF